MNGLEQKLRLEIQTQLNTRCNADATPHICTMIQTDEGYRKVEVDIINLVVTTGITPAAAIAQIESSYE